MVNIIKSNQLPEGENVYLKKGFTGEWRVVYPWKNEDGSRNWFAIFFGSKGNAIMLILVALIATGLYLGILDIISSCQQVAVNPCAYCADPIINYNNLNITP